MRKIVGCFHLNLTSEEMFRVMLDKYIQELQDDGQEVEVQYQATQLPNGGVNYGALILGKKLIID